MKTRFSFGGSTWLWGGLLVCLLTCGCVRYDVTLRNGDRIRAKTKPKKDDQGFYVFKDVTGREVRIYSSRVRQIEPVRAGSQPKGFYIQQ